MVVISSQDKKKKINEKSCGVLTFRETGDGPVFLILKYPGGHFGFPKGHVENNETEHETAIRELEEETGIRDVEFIDGYRHKIIYTFNNRGFKSTKLVVFFLGKTKTSKIKISHEHTDFMWMSYEDALEKVTFDNSKNLLKEAKKYI